DWRARLVDDFNNEERILAAFVEDEHSRDTLRSVVGLLHAFTALGLAVPAEAIHQFDDTVIDQLRRDEEFRPYLRGIVALMGANETRKAAGDAERARDLLDVAFLELSKFRAMLRRHG